MRKDNVNIILNSLNSAKVEYLIVGGLAVVAYGYLRFTADMDIVIALTEENIMRVVDVFVKLGYKPRVPVKIEDFANPEKRKEWSEKKNMIVFSLISEKFKTTPVDIFLSEPFDFQKEYKNAYWINLDKKLKVPFVNIDQLINMKSNSGRNKDIIDIENLLKIKAILNEKNK